MSAFPESHKDLLTAEVAVLATHGHDGFPQVTALWFLLDDDGVIKMSLNTARQKVKNLRKNPQCTFFVFDPATPYRTLEIRAQATITEDPDYSFAKKLSQKYGGMEFWAHDRPGERRVVVALQPVKVNTWG